MKTILYLGDPNSIHDLKWVSWFSERDGYEAFFLSETLEFEKLNPDIKDDFKKNRITLLEPIYSFSIIKPWRTVQGILTIRRIIKQHHISILHVMFATPYAFWVPFISIASIITTRGSDVFSVLPSLSYSNGLRKIHDKILLLLLGKSFQDCQAITCTSEGQIHRLQELFRLNKMPHLIRTGVNVNYITKLKSLKLQFIKHDKRIIFLPRYMQPIYRIDMQLDAIKLLPDKLKREIVIILIEGRNVDESYKNRLEIQLLDVDVDHIVLQTLNQDEMLSTLKNSALAIMTPRTDGTPNTALEAMAAKCPLILGNFTYDETLFGEQFCMRMKTDKPEELAYLIHQALTNYNPKLLQAAFHNVSMHGNRHIEMLKLEGVYENIFNANGH